MLTISVYVKYEISSMFLCVPVGISTEKNPPNCSFCYSAAVFSFLQDVNRVPGSVSHFDQRRTASYYELCSSPIRGTRWVYRMLLSYKALSALNSTENVSLGNHLCKCMTNSDYGNLYHIYLKAGTSSLNPSPLTFGSAYTSL